MRNTLLLMVALTALAGAKPGRTALLRNGTLQANTLPTADKTGRYEPGARSHFFWLVVAPDGLNGRAAMPDTYGQRFGDRPVVRFFPEGTLLTATSGAPSQADWTGVSDDEGKLWIRVFDGDVQHPGSYCLVCCNAKWLIPVRISEK